MDGLFAAALLLGASAFGAGFFSGALLAVGGQGPGERHSQRRPCVLDLTDEMREAAAGAIKPGDQLAETDLDFVHGDDDAAEASPASPGNRCYVSRPHKWGLA